MCLRWWGGGGGRTGLLSLLLPCEIVCYHGNAENGTQFVDLREVFLAKEVKQREYVRGSALISMTAPGGNRRLAYMACRLSAFFILYTF
jgi:hypothetical protein